MRRTTPDTSIKVRRPSPDRRSPPRERDPSRHSHLVGRRSPQLGSEKALPLAEAMQPLMPDVGLREDKLAEQVRREDARG